MKNNEQSLRRMWEAITHTSICIMTISERKEREKNIFQEIMTQKLSKLFVKHYTSRNLNNTK